MTTEALLRLGALSGRIAQQLAPLYAARRWTWHGIDIPDALTIESHLSGLIEELLADPHCDTLSSGRIRVTREGDEDGETWVVSLELEELWFSRKGCDG